MSRVWLFQTLERSNNRHTLPMIGFNYPETLLTAYVVNAPFLFWACWAIIRPWLDPVCNFHVLSDLLLIYICILHWKVTAAKASFVKKEVCFIVIAQTFFLTLTNESNNSNKKTRSWQKLSPKRTSMNK
jgi:CRAL/TRIO domain